MGTNLDNSSAGSDGKRWYPAATGRYPRALAAAILLLVMSVVVLADTGAWNALWSFTLGRGQSVEPLKPLKESFDQGLRQLRAQVPPGHSIYVDVPDPTSAWTQRLPEFAAMSGLTVATDRARADYDVTVTWIPGGVRLTARPLR
jgi:hypothetical protein